MITLPPDDCLTDIYDFKTVMEKAFAKVFTDAGMTAITAATPTDFQTKIPRVELKFTAGAGTKHGFVPVGQYLFNTTFGGTLAIRAVTRPDGEGKLVHAVYRARVFYVCAILGSLVNGEGNGLTHHRVNEPITQNGATDVFKTTDGYEYSDQNFSFDFSVSPGAFQKLLPINTN